MGEATRLIAAGIAAGVALTLLARPLLKDLLFGLTVGDPKVYEVTIAVLLGAGMLA